MFDVIGGVVLIFIKRGSVVELLGLSMDAHLDSQRAQAGHVFAVEIRHRARNQREIPFLAFARSNRELVRDKVELHVEAFVPKRNRRSGQPPRSDV
jgi:hypothetical protein